jgi:CRISPR/Cas system CSM-associated protein Csm4 (group 5 of RAMP superfamily)
MRLDRSGSNDSAYLFQMAVRSRQSSTSVMMRVRLLLHEPVTATTTMGAGLFFVESANVLWEQLEKK